MFFSDTKRKIFVTKQTCVTAGDSYNNSC